MQQVKQTLYGEPKATGKAKQWSVYVEGEKVIVEWGRVGGKMQTKETICIAKNVGRANETTPEQQALSEAESKWNKQWDKYYRPTIEEAEELEVAGVMLAQDYTKKPQYLEDTFYASVKLDGLRCKSVYDLDTDTLTWVSRGGKTYPVPEHLVSDLKFIHRVGGFRYLDGEAYVHGQKLQSIQSCVKKPNELTPQVTYEVFDVPVSELLWTDRLDLLNHVSTLLKNLEHSSVYVVEQKLATKSELEALHTKAVEDGFEGLMMRSVNGPYLFQNKRSNDLLKYKKMFDSEAKVLSCVEDKNGQGKFTMGWDNPDGKYVEFELSMNGAHEDNTYEKLFARIGEWVNFKYQDLTKDGKPSFARGIYFRECDEDGNPME